MRNLAETLKKGLPRHIWAFLKEAGTTAEQEGLPLFLVGGTVRDLLLERHIEDLDLVVQGDAPILASILAKEMAGEVIAHSQFATAKLKVGEVDIDLATARSETYLKPGALPTVLPGTLLQDLARRDFSINAMSVGLSPEDWGNLYDPYGGLEDTKAGLLKVLHQKSFQDDATRMLRAIRYEMRLDFSLERKAQELLRRDSKFLDTIGGDRIRHEIERIFQEDKAPGVLCRAQELGLLSAIHPALKLESHSQKALEKGRESPNNERPLFYLAILAYPLQVEETQGLISRLNMPIKWAEVVRDTVAVKDMTPYFEKSDLSKSQIYDMLKDCSSPALETNLLLSPSCKVRERLELHLNQLRFIRPLLGGRELIDMGVPQGPLIGELLDGLQKARLEGIVSGRKEEEQWVKVKLAELERVMK